MVFRNLKSNIRLLDDLLRIFNEVFEIAGNTTFSTNYNFDFAHWTGDVNMDSKVKYTAPQYDPSFVFNAILNYQLNLNLVTNYNFFIEKQP